MASDRIITALGGISGVHVTPYDSSGDPDWAAVAHVVKQIAAAGCTTSSPPATPANSIR